MSIYVFSKKIVEKRKTKKCEQKVESNRCLTYRSFSEKLIIAVNKHLYINPMDINVAEVMQRCHRKRTH